MRLEIFRFSRYSLKLLLPWVPRCAAVLATSIRPRTRLLLHWLKLASRFSPGRVRRRKIFGGALKSASPETSGNRT